MQPLNAEQQKEYDERLKNYQPTGSFANQTIIGFRRFVKGGVLDVEAVKAEGINDRQLPFLMIELEAAGYLAGDEKTAPADASGGGESEGESEAEE